MGNCFSCLNLNVTCFKGEVTNEIRLDVIIDNKCCQIGDIGVLNEKMEHLRALKRGWESQITGCTQGEVPYEVKTWLTQVGQLDDEVSTITPSGCFLCSNKKLGTLSKITLAETLISREKDLKDCISGCYQIGDIRILKENMEHLKALKRYVERQINDCTQREVPDVVKTWLTHVGQLDDEVSEILCSNKKLGTLSKITLAETLISREKDLKDCISRCTTAKKYIPPSSDPHIVGMKQLMSQVLEYLDDAEVGVVGIHGMGGAGKTTLAKQIIKTLQSSPSSPSTSAGKFNHIIFATVSQNPDIANLQKEIAVQLGIHRSSEFKDEEDESIRADFLRRYLYSRRFLLVLDDVWKELDLNSIGIPQLEEDVGNKIVLTTREAKVCTDMRANPEKIVKVGCLGKKESWELFQKTINWKDDKLKGKGVYEIAQEIAAKCGGLPLVLKTIARALTTKEDKASWETVRDQLKASPHEIRGMSDVYRLLEVSYNNLEKEEYRSCLLYSALFPEDYLMRIETLLDYCIGGGSVSSAGSSSSSSSIISGGIVELRKRGKSIISELIDACLLERVSLLRESPVFEYGDEDFYEDWSKVSDKDFVKVHDAIRDMILNVIGGQKIISYAGRGIEGTHAVDVEKWKAASMLSLSYNKIEELAMKEEEDHEKCTARQIQDDITELAMAEKIPFQSSSNLRVLLFDWNRLKNVPGWLFHYFPNLRVLDLSHTGIKEIPASLCSLQPLRYLNLSYCLSLKTLAKEMGNLRNLMQLKLRYCCSLETLAKEMGNLSNLIQLDLSHTNIDTLPKEIGNLSNLMQLDLSYTRIRTLPKEMGNLRNLMHLDLSGTMDLCDIPSRLFSSLSKLKSLKLKSCGFFYEDDREKRLQVLKDIGGDLPLLEDVRLSIIGVVRAVNFLVDESDSLSNSITELEIRGVDELFEGELFKRMGTRLKKLEKLKIESVHNGEVVFDEGHFSQLRELRIYDCNEVRDLACLWKLPNLTHLEIYCCTGIVEVMEPSQQEGDEIIHHQAILPKLQVIELFTCPKLVRISRSPLQLPSLSKLLIDDCPSLKDISVINSAPQVTIDCKREWWEDLQWENSQGVPPPNFKPRFPSTSTSDPIFF